MFIKKEDFLKENPIEPNAVAPEGKALTEILTFFREKRFFPAFRKMNIELTRDLIRESVNNDLLIIQAIHNMGDIDKVINTLAKRLREWYELHNPEFSRSVSDHSKFAELIIAKPKKELLKEIHRPDSMGADLSADDLKPIMNLAKEIVGLYELKKGHEGYIEQLMKKTCPNLLMLAGSSIGAKLIARAGSLRKLVNFPASTIQLLGAEKALFRHIKTKSRSPKYGYIHEHPLILKNKREIHGKIARALADKISIAVKVDFFKGAFISDKLKKALEARFA